MLVSHFCGAKADAFNCLLLDEDNSVCCSACRAAPADQSSVLEVKQLNRKMELWKGGRGVWGVVQGHEELLWERTVSKLLRAYAAACVLSALSRGWLLSPQSSTSVGRRGPCSSTCGRGCAVFPCLPEHSSMPFSPFIPGCLYLLLTDSLAWVHTARVTAVWEKSLESGN